MKSIIIKKNNNVSKLSIISLSIISSTLLLGGCSQVSGLLKSDDSKDQVDSALVIPPSLRLPQENNTAAKTSSTNSTTNARKVSSRSSNEVTDNRDYYVVVGTYPNQDQALNTFVRLSSIGLPHATMESRTTKSGKQLHMVRLGPFHKQTEIDRVKDKLVSDGMSQFKVVVN